MAASEPWVGENPLRATNKIGSQSKYMSHLIRTSGHRSYQSLIEELHGAHDHLVEMAGATLMEFQHSSSEWGARFKRLYVTFTASAPDVIGKERERLVEVINMVATLERLIDGITWFASNSSTAHLSVLECHPSTSSSQDGNDLVLGNASDDRRVIVEVTDVASGSAGQNGKEHKDLANLGCAAVVPTDGVRRYLCTSVEFATALASPKRKWSRRHYRYSVTMIQGTDTRLLEVIPAPRQLPNIGLQPTTEAGR